VLHCNATLRALKPTVAAAAPIFFVPIYLPTDIRRAVVWLRTVPRHQNVFRKIHFAETLKKPPSRHQIHPGAVCAQASVGSRNFRRTAVQRFAVHAQPATGLCTPNFSTQYPEAQRRTRCTLSNCRAQCT
jgi:hypothetical protein